MKKFFVGMLTALMLMGCSPAVKYERSTEMGTLNQITFDEMYEKMENKETFMFAFTQESCQNCLYFKEEILSEYIVDHGFDYYEIVLTVTQKDLERATAFVKQHPNPEDQTPEGFEVTDVLTPTFYFVEDGELKDIYVGVPAEKDFDALIVKYRLDEVK